MVTLTSKEGTKFELSLEAALQSKMVRATLDMDDNDNHDHDEKDAKPAHNGQDQVDHATGAGVDYHVDLPRVSTDTLAMVVEFLKHNEMEKMQAIPFPLKGDSLQDCIEQEWYSDFITAVGQVNMKEKEEVERKDSTSKKEEQLDQPSQNDNDADNDNDNATTTAVVIRNELFTLLEAANYMDIQVLIDLIVLRVTFQVIGKNAQELSDYFNLPMPTKEDEDFAREHYPWILKENNQK
jgi:hypothetical protein